MRGWAYHCINYAMLSDTAYWNLGELKLRFLPSQRLGIEGTARQPVVGSFMRAAALNQIGAASEYFDRHWKQVRSENERERFRSELDAATENEFGHPASELLDLMAVGISIAQEDPSGRVSVRTEDVIGRAAKELNRSRDSIRHALDLLTLGPRASFWTPPPGFTRRDLYPWRYNRPLSYLRRPFLAHYVENSLQITWGFRHLRAAQHFLLSQCTSGKINATTAQLRSFVSGLLDERGEAFNDKVFNFFNERGDLSIKSRVRKIGRLHELKNSLGDIDVLVGDARRRRIVVIECKDLSLSRTPYEMAQELAELFQGVRGRKSIVARHIARTSWIAAHLSEVVSFLGLQKSKRWDVIPLIVVDQPLFASYVRESPAQVLSLEEIRQSWPKLERI